MNFEELQMIWDSQKQEPMFVIDKNSLDRFIDQQSVAIRSDLKSLEITAIIVLIVLGIITLVDTFFNGKEYFQLWSVAFEFSAACFLWVRRRHRETQTSEKPSNLLKRIEMAISQVRTTIARGRDMAIVMSLFVTYGVAIRVWIYGWRGSEFKFVAAVCCIAMLTLGMKIAESVTHKRRLQELVALRKKLLDVSPN